MLETFKMDISLELELIEEVCREIGDSEQCMALSWMILISCILTLSIDD